MAEMKSLTLNDKKYDCFVDLVARAWASASTMSNSVSGESHTVTDASNSKLLGLRIFGKTIQDGVPTPEAPVELENIGKGSISVNVNGKYDTQSMTIATPNGLSGIPVDSGGNYTDANGQQWICDEIDLARGVYVQRVHKETIFADNFVSTYNQFVTTYGASVSVLLSKNNLTNTGVTTMVSDRATGVALDYRDDYADIYRCYTVQSPGSFVFRYPINTGEKSIEDAKKDFSGAVIQYILATPIETPLSEEELAAYADLHTYKDNTTVSNDAGAWMDLEYVMDAKKYIDSLVGGGIAPARVE
jgi:hypothetical protein